MLSSQIRLVSTVCDGVNYTAFPSSSKVLLDSDVLEGCHILIGELWLRFCFIWCSGGGVAGTVKKQTGNVKRA